MSAAWAGPEGEHAGGRPRGHGMPWQVALSMRQWRSALPGLREALSASPDDPELHARQGLVFARIGEFGDAAGAFRFAEGAAFYEERCLGDHADALRFTGDAAAAAALRRSWIATLGDPKDLAEAELGLAEDLRALGDLDGAADAAARALALAPAAEDVYVTLADVAMDRGDLDEAEGQLWLADRTGGGGAPGTRTAWARLALAHGDLDTAYEAVRRGRRKGRDLGPWAMQGEVLRRMGEPETCLSLLDSGFLRDRSRPEMVATRLACLASAGELDEAEHLARRARSLYPHDARVLGALAVFEEARRLPTRGNPG